MVGFHQLIISIWKPGGNHSFSPGPGFHNILVIFLFTRCWFLKNGNGNVAIVGPRCASSNCLVLYDIAWYCVVLRGTAWYFMVLDGIAWYCVVLQCIAWYYYCMMLRGIAWYCVVLHGMCLVMSNWITLFKWSWLILVSHKLCLWAELLEIWKSCLSCLWYRVDNYSIWRIEHLTKDLLAKFDIKHSPKSTLSLLRIENHNVAFTVFYCFCI